jgi:hypothetical protein
MAGRNPAGGGKRFLAPVHPGSGSAHGGPPAGASSRPPAPGAEVAPPGWDEVARDVNPRGAGTSPISGCWLLPVAAPPTLR